MSIFGANIGDLSQTGTTIKNLGEEYNANIINIFNEIDNLSGKWSGGASEAYITAVNGHRADLQKLGETIETMGIKLIGASVSFEENEVYLTEQANKQLNL